jgi:hypothetical protein
MQKNSRNIRENLIVCLTFILIVLTTYLHGTWYAAMVSEQAKISMHHPHHPTMHLW